MKIYVKVLASQRTLCLRIGEYSRVESVKRWVLDRLHAPKSGVRRLYRAASTAGELEPLEDAESLHHYHIQEGDTLYLGMKVAVIADVVGGRSSVPVNVNTADSVEAVKSLLQKKIGVHPNEQRLVIGGKLVQDAGKVRDYELKSNDTFFVIRRKRQFNVEIESESGPVRKLQVRADTTVRQVKQMIADVTSTPIHLQSLFFRQQKLRDNKTIKFYSISPGSKLQLGVHGQMFIRALSGRTLTLDVGEGDSVQAVKSLIREREGIPICEQKLFFEGKQLQHGRLEECGVRNGSTLELSLSLPGGRQMEIYIRTVKGLTIIVEVDGDATILELKKKIQEQKGYSVDHQKLIFCGMELEDCQTVSDYNIQRATTLHLVVGQPQGEQRVSVTITTPTGKELRCSVVLSSKVESLTETIEQSEGIPKKCQRLFHKGVLADRGKLLKDFVNGGSNSSQVKWEVCMYLEVRGDIEVFIKILSNTSKTSAIKRFEKMISLSVDKQMRVSTLKEIIQHREKIPTYFQTLLFNGEVMRDEFLLMQWEQSIQDKCILHLWPERLDHDTKLTVTVSTPTNSIDLQNLALFVKIRDVKLSSRCLVDTCDDSTVEEYRLFHGSIPFENEKSLHEYRITDGSKLQLVPPNEFPVFINATRNGKRAKFFINAKKTDTVKTVKNRICGTANIPVSNVLYLSGVVLKDSKTMEECHISAACTLSSVPQGEIPIAVRTRFTTVPFSIHPSNSVHDIMESIASTSEIGVDPPNQRLLLHNVLLSSPKNCHQLIKECGISAGNTLNLVTTPEELDIYICTPRGSTLALVCLCDCTVRDLKAAIEENKEIPVENQILPFESDDKTLREYGVEPGKHLDLVHQSVAQLKAALDQQEVCERAITRQQNQWLRQRLESAHMDEYVLKQELESTKQELNNEKSFNELQLDSASNYLQGKVTTFEGDLAQSRERISELEKENRDMHERLESQRKTIAEKKDKLSHLQTKLESGSLMMRRGSSQSSTLSDIAEDVVDTSITSVDGGEGEPGGPIQMHISSLSVSLQDYTDCGFRREFVYSGEECCWPCEEDNDRGIRISFPQHTQKRQIHVTVMSLNSCTEDIDIDGDNDVEFVSAVYHVQLSSPLPTPVTVEIQHCIHITNPDIASSLTFLRSSSDEDPFTPIKGGQFDVNSRYGKIQLSQFSSFGIGRLFRRSRDTVYVASVFSSRSEPKRYDLHVVVTKDLKDHLMQLGSVYKDWKLAVQPELKFMGPISCEFQQETPDNCWIVSELQEGAKILRQSVNKYRPGKRIPHLRLRVTWESSEPPRKEDVALKLSGAVNPDGEGKKVSFIFECGPYFYAHSTSVSSDTSTPCSSVGRPLSRVECSSEHLIFNEQVTLGRLTCLRCTDENGEDRELRVKDQLGTGWRDLASQLEFSPARIGAFSHSLAPVDDMISTWLQTNERCSWRRFIEKLSHAGLRPLAIDLRYALMHIVTDT